MGKAFAKYNLPHNWVWATLGDLGIITSGGTPSTTKKRYWDGNIPWVTPADLTGWEGKYISRGRRFISEDGLEESSAYILPKGSILFSSRAPIGYVAIAENSIATNQGFKNLIPTQSLYSDYIFYYLKSSKQLAESYASGTTFLELSASKFAQIPIPLPPAKEQRLIVVRLEELFSDLDHSLKYLERSRSQLLAYRQSLLKNAFEGKLTAEWRKENNPEPVKKFLNRISEERKLKYQQELTKWKEELKEWNKTRQDSKPRKPAKPIEYAKLGKNDIENSQQFRNHGCG
ncbi:MAG: restriction endonuclease subunit S [Cyanobacteria bacterium P01_F01_bin.143]